MNQKSKAMKLEELPGEIVELIFSKLPFFNLPNCRQVCRSWNNLVLTCKFDPKTSMNSNLFLAQFYPPANHLAWYCVDFDHKNSESSGIVASFSFDPNCWSLNRTVKIINSCNGLLCCSLRLDNCSEVICIVNPMTNEYFKLPSNSQAYDYSFGISSKTKQYKIVRHSHSDGATLIEIFAFGTSTNSRQWNHVVTVPSTLRHQCGTYSNGALYWIGAHRYPFTIDIFRLDLEEEKFEEVCFTQPRRRVFSSFLGVHRDTLYLTILHGFYYHVWKMERDCSSWTKAFFVLLPKHVAFYQLFIQLVKVYEDGNILFHLVGHGLILYDSETSRTQMTSQDGIKKKFYFYQIDTSSLSFDSLHTILAGDG